MKQRRMTARKGDRVQWTASGQDMFAKGTRVRGVLGRHGGERYLSVEGTNTGVPASQTTLLEAGPRRAKLKAAVAKGIRRRAITKGALIAGAGVAGAAAAAYGAKKLLGKKGGKKAAPMPRRRAA